MILLIIYFDAKLFDIEVLLATGENCPEEK